MTLPTIELWADGSGSAIGTPGGWAFILRVRKADGSWAERVDAGCVSATSSNRMEIASALMGLRALTKPCIVDLYSDSQYVVNAIGQRWIGAWKSRGWPSKIKNQDLWRELDGSLRLHDVRSHWVKGHSGVALNERCDQLAGEQRARAVAASDVWHPEPAGEFIAKQPSLLDPDAEAHLEALALG